MDKLADWLAYLESIHPKTIDMGLDRVEQVAQRLGFDWSNTVVITVAGTNGKGTTCRFIEAYLLATGKSVATFRSPHLIDYRERVTFNAEMLDEAAYVDAFKAVESARGNTTLTYFEFGTLAALVMMQTRQPEFALLEVGLGGRLDATNIVDTDCAIITTIGLDHQAFLGDTLEAIATEKAGIFRQHAPAVIGEPMPPHTLVKAAMTINSAVVFAQQDFSYQEHSDATWSWRGVRDDFSHLPAAKIPTQNVSTALAALETLGFSLERERIITAIDNAQLPGRRQVIQHAPFVLLDVAHNPQAVENLIEIMRARLATGRLYAIVGMLKDKAIAQTLQCFSSLSVDWHCVCTTGPRGCSASEIQCHLPAESESMQHSSARQAYLHLIDKVSDNDSIFVFGSFVTVADVLAYVTAQK